MLLLSSEQKLMKMKMQVMAQVRHKIDSIMLKLACQRVLNLQYLLAACFFQRFLSLAFCTRLENVFVALVEAHAKVDHIDI